MVELHLQKIKKIARLAAPDAIANRIKFEVQNNLYKKNETTRYFHFSYHKCLTVYYSKVLGQSLNSEIPYSYRHFNSELSEFYESLRHLQGASVNNHIPDFSSLPKFRASHFIRDPRDLVVSGYFYHRRGAESWCSITDPCENDWALVNGCIPADMQAGQSFQSYLQSVDTETGLMAEIEFRQRHFESMQDWPYDHPDIIEFRYEDILGRETDVFAEICDFLDVSPNIRARSLEYAKTYAASNFSEKTQHIRNPRSGQWREHFSPKVEAFLNERHPTLLKNTGYN